MIRENERQTFDGDVMVHPRATDGSKQVVILEDDTSSFVGYILDIVRFVFQINNWNIPSITVAGAIDSKTRVTAELGGGFTADPPKRVADVDVPAAVCRAVGVT